MSKKDGGKTQRGYFFSKKSYCQVKCTSDNPVKKLSDKSENVPLNVGTRKPKVFIGMFFCSTCSHVQLESSFYNPVEEFVTKCRWFSAQHLKTLSSFLTKCCYGHVEGSFDNFIKKTFDRKRKTVRSRSEKKLLEAFLKNILASLFFLRHVETSSDKLGGNGFSKSGKFSTSDRKWRKDSLEHLLLEGFL